MDSVLATLKYLGRNPFFRTIGRYKGLNQESMVLQKATGYSQVYRTWNLLRRAYSLYDGIYRLQTKDIATLYEIWCCSVDNLFWCCFVQFFISIFCIHTK